MDVLSTKHLMHITLTKVSIDEKNFLPVEAMVADKLVLINVFPAFGLAPEIIKTLFFASIIAKCRLVRKLLIASTAKSAGFSIANSFSDSFFSVLSY